MPSRICFGLILLSVVSIAGAQQAEMTRGVDLNTGGSFPIAANSPPPPRQWIDKDTGHRIIRLTDEPNSESLYFNDYAFSPDGTKLAFTSPTGIYQVDLSTLDQGTRTIEPILLAPTVQFAPVRTGKLIGIMMVGRKTGRIYYTQTVFNNPGDVTTAQRSIWWIDPATKEQHKIADVPAGVTIATVNADETMLAGGITYYDGRGGAATQPVRAARGERINLAARWAQHLPMALVTLNIQSGEIKTFNPSNDWDNHFQFSPTDPMQLLYCHEGPWQNNDRVWTIRTDGTGLFKVHERTMIDEIWGHEFWSGDGRTIWYQLDLPRGQGGTSWIAGYNLDSRRQIWYHNADNTGSIHVNVSPDGSLFAGDGGTGAPWLFLFHPHLDRNLAEGVYDASHLIQPGYMEAEKLVNMSKHQYQLEPNANFTPNMKWIIFRSNMLGPAFAFAVEIARAK